MFFPIRLAGPAHIKIFDIGVQEKSIDQNIKS